MQTMLKSLRSVGRIFPRAHDYRSYSLLSRVTFLQKPSIFTHFSRFVASQNKTTDKDFAAILREEIKLEKEISQKSSASKSSPPKGFKVVKQNGSEYVLHRQFEDGVTVEVLFDLAGSVNPPSDVPEEEMQDTTNANTSEEEHGQSLLSRPDFKIRLIKPGCSQSLCFHCSFSGDAAADFAEMAEHEREKDSDMLTFSVDSVQMVPSKATLADMEKGYFVYTDLFDDNIFEHTVQLLMDRGIDGKFEQDLVEFCTAQEHTLYVNFLSQLEGYCRGQ